MNRRQAPQPRLQERLAAFGAATTMTLAVMAGIGTLAQTQQAAPEDIAQAPAPLVDVTPQRVLVVGQRAPQQVFVVGQRAPRT
ncbi:hypothetical protein [Aquabacterium humicola]|uniref:hypothetical protein n=1 Tax=Aquabacterium humicola TaxID=3237377 RepID=UPI002543E69C|nr:hypothetical protein [Rubrivivax pictus]